MYGVTVCAGHLSGQMSEWLVTGWLVGDSLAGWLVGGFTDWLDLLGESLTGWLRD